MDKTNQKLRALRELWDKKKVVDRLPRRADFDPKTLRPWIGNLALVEIVPNGDLLFRICGTNLHSRFGGEFTGRDVSALSPEIARDFRQALRQACQTRVPVEITHDYVVDGEARTFRDICLPLSDDTPINTVLFASFQVLKK